jgi:hypothetical protein
MQYFHLKDTNIVDCMLSKIYRSLPSNVWFNPPREIICCAISDALINISKQREPDVENADQQQKMSISDVITPVIPLICESVMLYSTPTLLYDKLILCYRDTIEDEDYTQNYREFSKLCAQFMGIFMFVNNKLNNNKEDEKADVDVDEDEDVDENVIKHAISCKNRN